MPSVYSTDLVAAVIVRVVSVVTIKAERDSDDSEFVFVMTMAVVMTATLPRSTAKLLASRPRATSVPLAATIVTYWAAHSGTRCHRRCCSAAPTAHNSCAPYGCSSAFTASSAHDSGTPAATSNATAYSCSAPAATTTPAACSRSAPTATTCSAACSGSAPTATSAPAAATLLSCGNINHDGRSSKCCDSD